MAAAMNETEEEECFMRKIFTITRKDEEDYVHESKMTKLDPDTRREVKYLVPHLYALFAVLKSDRVLAYGWNFNGELGIGHSNVQNFFEEMTEVRAMKIKKLAPAKSFGLVLTEEGKLLNWKADFSGRFPNASVSCVCCYCARGCANSISLCLQYPRPCLHSGIVDVVNGHQHSLALNAQGQILSWGFNTNGQLGRDFEVPLFCSTVKSQIGVIETLNGLVFAHIAAGFNSSAAITSDGRAYVWGGYDIFNLLREGVKKRSDFYPERVPLPPNVRARKAAVGLEHTLFLTTEGRIYVHDTSKGTRLIDTDGDLRFKHIMVTIGLALAWTANGDFYYWTDVGQDQPVEFERMRGNVERDGYKRYVRKPMKSPLTIFQLSRKNDQLVLPLLYLAEEKT